MSTTCTKRGNTSCRASCRGRPAPLSRMPACPVFPIREKTLVRLCAAHGVTVTVVPGPSAAVSALAVSGLVTSRFTFEGFLSTNKASRMEHLSSLENERRTMIFYEAPHKLSATLGDLKSVFGADRPLSVCRELTKIHEEILRTTIGGACEYFEQNTPKGEFVLIVSRAGKAGSRSASA